MNNTVKFLADYVQENINAIEDAQEYIKNRGFLDSFGIDRLATAGAEEQFATRFQAILDNCEDEKDVVKFAKEYIQERLVNTATFNSTSLGANILTLAELQHAQYLARKFEWWEAVDASSPDVQQHITGRTS